MSCKVECSAQTVSQLRLYAEHLVAFADHYKELTDSYVVEFFVKKRWEILPASWQRALHDLQPEDIARLLLEDKPPESFPSVWPLSLLAYRASTHALALDPTPVGEFEPSPVYSDPELKPIDLLCRLHVKPKKRHEILRMAEKIKLVCQETGTDRVVDVGSGQGHLSRLMSFGHGLDVTSIEAVGCHLTGAAKVDTKIKTIIQKRVAKQSSGTHNHLSPTPPQHVECTVHPHITVDEFVNVINNQSSEAHERVDQSTGDGQVDADSCTAEGQRTSVNSSKNQTVEALNNYSSEQGNVPLHDPSNILRNNIEPSEPEDSTLVSVSEAIKDPAISLTPKSKAKGESPFVIAGLHTCGDLAPTMLRVFARCHQARGLASVACCYMRMDCAIPPKTNGAIPTDSDVSSLSAGIENKTVTLSERSARSKSHQTPVKVPQNMKETDENGTVSHSLQELQRSEESYPSVEKKLDNSLSSQNHQHLDEMHRTEERRKSDVSKERNEEISSEMTNSATGYPMSQWVKDLGGKGLWFEALELACHSLHSYKERLKAKDQNLHLHGYRSALEVLIQEADPQITQNHAGVCRIKKAVATIRKPHLKTFEEYVSTALATLDLPCDEDKLSDMKERCLPQSNNVIAFHVIRSMMGPIIESLVLVDRVLFLYEKGINSRLVPVFDASLSPRNFALVATKN